MNQEGIVFHAGTPEPSLSATVFSGRCVAAFSGVLLLICLGVVILLAKALAPMIEAAADRMQAPKAVVGFPEADYLKVLVFSGPAAGTYVCPHVTFYPLSSQLEARDCVRT